MMKLGKVKTWLASSERVQLRSCALPFPSLRISTYSLPSGMMKMMLMSASWIWVAVGLAVLVGVGVAVDGRGVGVLVGVAVGMGVGVLGGLWTRGR